MSTPENECPCGAGEIDANGLCPDGHDDLDRAGITGPVQIEVLEPPPGGGPVPRLEGDNIIKSWRYRGP